MNIGFTKMHGLGNDFVFIDNMNGRISLSVEQIVSLCDRHFGIGADGVVLVESSDKADCFMNYYNSDGSPGLCGNGLRSTAKFFKEEMDIKKDFENNILKIETRAGIKELKFLDDGNISVNMGKGIFKHEDFPDTSTEVENVVFNFVSVGNPHAIAFVNNVDEINLLEVGSRVEKYKLFPNKINVEFVEEISNHEYKVRVWERACGVTLACGTGATAVYAFLRKNRDIPKDIEINLPGGKLFFSENDDGDIIMRGPAEIVFSGIIQI